MESSDELQWVGFWRDEDCQNYPDPKDLVNLDWSKQERSRIAKYLREGICLTSYLGYSFCRLECGIPDEEMGDCDLTDGAWVWPEGLAHYVEAHSVKLPPQFMAHIRANNFEVPSGASRFKEGASEVDFNEIPKSDRVWVEFGKSLLKQA